LIFHVFGAIAHFERRLISKRTKDGILAARMRGKKPGRPPLDPETALALQNLVQAGMTAGQAAKQLGIARSTAYRLIKETTET
jgi:DNA invertase Pin-like site-specific DNA recombinase